MMILSARQHHCTPSPTSPENGVLPMRSIEVVAVALMLAHGVILCCRPASNARHTAPQSTLIRSRGCTWTAVGTRTTAQNHAVRQHQGNGYHLYRPDGEHAVLEQRKARIRELDRQRQRKRYHEARQAQGHAATAQLAVQGLLALAPDMTPEGRSWFPVEMDGSGRVEEVRCWIQRDGRGDCEINGTLSGCSRGAVRVAVTWVTAHWKVLSQWLPSAALERGKGPRSHELLWRERERLIVHVERMDSRTVGSSLTVAAALSLLCLALRCRADESVVTTGSMDLRGNIGDVEGLTGKLEGCMNKGVRKLLVPASSPRRFDRATLATEQLRQYAQEALQE